MRKAIFLLTTILFLATSCKETTPNLSKELAAAKAENEILKQAIEIENKGKLFHTVYLKLKEETTAEEIAKIIKEIEKLEAIKGIKDLEIGTFKDLGDARAMSDCQIMFQMILENEADYKVYQAHEIHQNLKKAIGGYLAGPPVTHDFVGM